MKKNNRGELLLGTVLVWMWATFVVGATGNHLYETYGKKDQDKTTVIISIARNGEVLHRLKMSDVK